MSLFKSKWKTSLPPRIFNLTPFLLDDPFAFKQMFGEQVIFYVETTDSVNLKPRDVCSLESVTTFNPTVPVIIVVTVTNHTSDRLPFYNSTSFQSLMNNTQNLYVAWATIPDIARDTILEQFLFNDTRILNSEYRPAHVCDFVRFLLLWKLGGVYLDFDTITFKSLASVMKLKNFLIATFSNGILTQAMGFERRNRWVELLMNCTKNEYYSTLYPIVPYTVTSVLSKIFNISFNDPGAADNINSQVNESLHILGSEIFYPFDYENIKLAMVNSSFIGYMEKAFETHYGIHTFNRLTGHLRVGVNSSKPLAVVARKFCLRTTSLAGTHI
ncbi:lactosylceramide 4-alpha-galactosyltransferase-like [Cloeon dipterum]|uniref:lactosylceramide 4-alpha-galactosyltransferase-like n=1 Tax=Cloeon dipterum TaxID=197152 RepID=UPI0032206BE9